MDDGRRTTATKDTLEEATRWAAAMEDERDRQREARSKLNESARTRAVLSALRELADQGLLSADQKREIRALID
jgi:hypothetical protein